MLLLATINSESSFRNHSSTHHYQQHVVDVTGGGMRVYFPGYSATSVIARSGSW